MQRTQVAIIGGGPSGLLLAQLLQIDGIDSIVLERQSREHVEARIRAGLLEWSTVELLRSARVAERMDREGLVHRGFGLAFEERTQRIDLHALAGKDVLVYGQTEIQKDLTEARLAAGAAPIWNAQDVELLDFAGPRPRVAWTHGGTRHEVACDFIAGCDGHHGVSRASVPRAQIRQYERVYPFGWLGVLANVPPIAEELLYAKHERGFALCSMRSRRLSRFYVQCPLHDGIEHWPDARFWEELALRLPREQAARLVTGPTIEKSIAPLRSFVAEPMRFGSLFLAGDAAHIVPPTGAKGLNLAAADVGLLHRGFVEHYRGGGAKLLEEYSVRALARVWKATRFSWWFTLLMHRLSDDPMTHRLQLAELEYLAESTAAARAMAENYAGLTAGLGKWYATRTNGLRLP
jgi:p-hydroxybenzoate 3-monooxygenase